MDSDYNPSQPEQPQRSEKDQRDKPSAPPGCLEEFPTLSVGDMMVESFEQWKKLKKENKLFVLSASDSFCSTCCQDEPVLASFINDRSHLKYKGKQIPIVRVDASRRYSFLENDGLVFGDLPVTIFYIDGDFHVHKEAYYNMRTYTTFLHHLNRLMDPVPVLKKDELVASFLDLSKQWEGDFKGPLFKAVTDRA